MELRLIPTLKQHGRLLPSLPVCYTRGDQKFTRISLYMIDKTHLAIS